MSGIFKAYDVRGIYPEQVNETVAEAIGLAFRETLDDEDRSHGRTVVVSRDMREHGVPLAEALIHGLTAGGLDVLDIGLATTPMSYFAVGHLGTTAGIQVTASHNPAEYNGMKFSRSDARPFAGERGIPHLERLVEGGGISAAEARGTISTGDVFEAYQRRMLSFLERPEREAAALKVVVDAANGMGALYGPILDELPIELVRLYFELDGTFPNHEANPLKLENLRDLSREVRATGAGLGVAFDGDADRAAFVDETGEPVGSDLITALIAGELLRHHPGGVVLYDLRSSRAVAEWVREHGGEPVRERVGHTFMKATLRERGGLFGGELAGHYYFRDTYHADSSLLAVIEIVNLLRRSGKTLSELVQPLRRYAKSPEINFEVEDKQGMLEELARRYANGEIDHLDGITVQYPDWWFNVRPSNTEPYLRLVLEAANSEQLAEKQAELESLLGTPI